MREVETHDYALDGLCSGNGLPSLKFNQRKITENNSNANFREHRMVPLARHCLLPGLQSQ